MVDDNSTSDSRSTITTPPASLSSSNSQDLKNLAQLVYILQAFSLVLGITAVIGLFINYIKKDEVKGTYLESHFSWQIKSFWYGLLGIMLGYLLTIVLIGFVILAVTILWYIYRMVKGCLALNDGKVI